MTEKINFPLDGSEPQVQEPLDGAPNHRQLQHYARIFPETQLGYILRIPKPEFMDQSGQADEAVLDKSE